MPQVNPPKLDYRPKRRSILDVIYETKMRGPSFESGVQRKENQKPRAGGYGGGSFGGGGAGGSWDTNEPSEVKERKKASTVTSPIITINKQPIKSTNKKSRRTKLIKRQTVPQPVQMQLINSVAIPLDTELITPETIQAPEIQQEPIHYTRKMVRDYLRAKGEHPYDYGAFNRRALRHYLNGDKPVKQKYYDQIERVVGAPYVDNNTPVTTGTDLQDIFYNRN